MDINSNNRFSWFNHYSSSQANIRRLRTPIHYYLRKHDYVTAHAFLRNGTDPTIIDECGRTALDLAVQMCIEMLQTVLCTSFPLDFVDDQLDERLFSSCMIYNEGNYFDFDDSNSCHSSSKKPKKTNSASSCDFSPDFPLQIDCCPSCPNKNTCNVRERKPYVEQKTGMDYKKLDSTMQNGNEVGLFPLPEIEEKENYEAFSKCGKPNEDQLIQQDVLMVVENTITKALPRKIIARMEELLRRLKATINFIKLLSHSACFCESAVEKASLLIKHITYPFLYTALLRTSFKLYPNNPYGAFWDVENPVDARRLVNIIVNKQLRLHEIYKYLGAASKYVVELVQLFGSQILRHQSVHVAQYWLHFSFVLDSPQLFEIICAEKSQLFLNNHLFKWDRLLCDLMKVRQKFPRFTAALNKARLKSRIQERFLTEEVDNKKKNNQAKQNEKILMPFEERYLKNEVIDNYQHFYGRHEAKDLNQMLKEWKYGAYRQKA